LKKHFIENLIFFLALNLIIKPIYVFGIDRVVQNTVGTEIFGSYFALFNMVIIFQIFLDLGIENFTRKEIAHDPKTVNKLFSSFLVLKLILIILFIGTLSIIGLFLPLSKEEWKLLILLLINQSLANLILFLRANLGGLHLFKTESFVSVFDRIFMILVCGSLLYTPIAQNKFRIEWFLYAQSAAYLATVFIGIILLVRKTGVPKFKISVNEYLVVTKKLLPYASLVLLMSFYYRIDSVFLRYLLPDGKVQAGIYAHSFRLLDFMSNYALIFSFILLPLFAKMINQKEQIHSLLKLSALALIIPSLILLSGIVFYRIEIFNLLYRSHTNLSANTFLILIVSYLGVCFSYTFGALLTANGNLRELNTMAIIAVLLSIILNIILIPKLKVTGAAITNGITQFFTILFHFYVVKKKFQLKLNPKLILKIILFLILTFLSGWLITQSHIHWFLGCIVISLISGVLAILTGLINLSYFKMLFRFDKTGQDLSTTSPN
jgi:O-antigen/teichoic acid export membrane protein